jgi:hypothetical protein
MNERRPQHWRASSRHSFTPRLARRVRRQAWRFMPASRAQSATTTATAAPAPHLLLLIEAVQSADTARAPAQESRPGPSAALVYGGDEEVRPERERRGQRVNERPSCPAWIRSRRSFTHTMNERHPTTGTNRAGTRSRRGSAGGRPADRGALCPHSAHNPPRAPPEELQHQTSSSSSMPYTHPACSTHARARTLRLGVRSANEHRPSERDRPALLPGVGGGVGDAARSAICPGRDARRAGQPAARSGRSVRVSG